MEEISFIGLDKLDTFEIDKVKGLTAKFSPKLFRSYPNAKLIIHVKTQNTDGERKQFNFNLKLEDASLPKGFLSANNQSQYNWDLLVILHDTFKNLENQIGDKSKPKKELKF